MTALTAPARAPVTARGSVSWYLPPTHRLLRQSVALVDGVTISGPKGPETIRRLRSGGFSAPVLFDGCGYAGRQLPQAAGWVELQSRAGADRLLLPGTYVEWEADEQEAIGTLSRVVALEASIARDLGAVVLLAIDSRWLARRTGVLLHVLGVASVPIALVLANRADPLSTNGAVSGLRQLAQRLPDLLLLRSDQGAIGAVAFGAAHASIGLSTSNRHFVAGPMKAQKRPDRSSRVFVRSLLDWFLASDIAGWTAAGRDITCHLPCCDGADLARFLDEDLDATWHNLHALADFADLILGVNPEDRAIEFIRECREAAARYGLAGFKGPENPKAQLTGWAFS